MHPGLVASLAQAVFGQLGSVKRDAERATISITIPGDHPKAQQLRQLAAELAHYRRLASGLEINRRYLPGSEERLKDLLRDIVDGTAGAGMFDKLMMDLEQRQVQLDAKTQIGHLAQQFADPATMGKVVVEAFKEKALSAETMAHHDAVRLLNKAEEQARTGKLILDQAGA